MLNTMLYYLNYIAQYLAQMIPCAVLSLLVCVCLNPWRKRKLEENGLTEGIGRQVILLFFILFCAGLAALTMFPREFWSEFLRGDRLNWSSIFVGSFYWHISIFDDFSSGSWTLFILLGNVIMFVPFGFVPALLWRKSCWLKSLLLAFCASLLIEFVQLFVGRSSDVNDLILNAMGGLVGYWLYLLLHQFAPRFTDRMKCHQAEGLNGRENRT